MATPGNRLILQGFGGPRLITQGFGPKLAYRNAFYYDKKGNVTCVLDPDNGQTYYTYDKVNRMTSVLSPWGEATYYDYDIGGLVTKRTLGNGCYTYYEYDEVDQVASVVNCQSDGTVISSFEYQRDCVGNPLSILREDGAVTYYDYDKKYQLTEEIQVDPYGATVYAWTWDYDLAGNRTAQVFNGEVTYYEYNASNELVTEVTGSATTYYQYDHRGNQTVKQEPSGTTYFQYNHQNLLTRIDLPDATSNEFGYDGDSKRVWVNDSLGARRMVYQGPDMLKLFQEKDDSGNTQAQYTMGLGLESMRRGAASSFYHYDALGSTQELTDAGGAVTDTYRYNAWGKTLAKAGSTVNPHGYVGKLRYYGQKDLALSLLGFRYLECDSGRLLSLDAVLRAISRYSYVGGRPTVGIDPMGLDFVVPWYPLPGGGGSYPAPPNDEGKCFSLDLPLGPLLYATGKQCVICYRQTGCYEEKQTTYLLVMVGPNLGPGDLWKKLKGADLVKSVVQAFDYLAAALGNNRILPDKPCACGCPQPHSTTTWGGQLKLCAGFATLIVQWTPNGATNTYEEWGPCPPEATGGVTKTAVSWPAIE